MAMWSMPPKLKDLFSGFEKYGHSGTRWINPRHNVLRTLTCTTALDVWRDNRWLLKDPALPCMRTYFFQVFLTWSQVERWKSGIQTALTVSVGLTTLPHYKVPCHWSQTRSKSPPWSLEPPQALIHGPKLCKAKGCHQFSGRTCRSQTARSGHQNWGPEPKDCSHGKCHWPGLSWYELPHGLPVECVNWWPSGLVGWATSACGDCHLNLSNVSLCWLFQMFLSSGLLVSPWVNGYIFGCPLPIPGTCCCQLVSGVLGLANASLVCVISGRCPTASPATVGGALYAASCGYFL